MSHWQAIAASHGGIYDTHLRDEGSYSIGLLASVEETLDIARGASIPVHISHLKALGKDVWGASDDVIALINEARDDGLDVTANQYPWRASGTRFSNAILPRWAIADGYDGTDETSNPELRIEMERNLERRGGPAAALMVTGADSPYRGKRLDEIAAELGVTPVEAARQLARGDDPSIASFVMSPDDVDAFAAQSWVMTGSGWFLRAPPTVCDLPEGLAGPRGRRSHRQKQVRVAQRRIRGRNV